MSFRIHHLNCGSMCPLCQRLMNDRSGSWCEPGNFVCHCLLIETAETLVLVDTGLGQNDVANPKKQLGQSYLSVFRPQLAQEETAIVQIRALGFDPRDVRHIVVTHLDLDHAGGLADFPDAQVHLFEPELVQIQKPGLRERSRFRMVQFRHQPRWVPHANKGEHWFGFNSIRAIPGLDDEILLIPLIGHTRGHTGVAVRQKDKWLLHCGDAYYHHSQVTMTPQVPEGSIFFQKLIASIPKARVDNLERLQQLATQHSNQVDLICAHDPVDLNRFATR